MKTFASFFALIAPAMAQDLFLAVPTAKVRPIRDTPNGSCVPDYSCGTAKACCSGRSYFVSQALAMCGAAGETECNMCKTVTTYVAKHLMAEASTASCDNLDVPSICKEVQIDEGDMLWPICSAVIMKGCAKIVPYIEKKLDDPDMLDEKVCTETFGVCPVNKDQPWTFCGCLPKGECVDPLTNPSDTCCSGKWKFNYGASCGKNYHNLPAPAQCL